MANAIPNDSTWIGTYTIVGVETPLPYQISFNSRNGVAIGGTILLGGQITGTFDGALVANRLTGTSVTSEGNAKWSALVTNHGMHGAWAAIGAQGNGTFQATRQDNQ
ncbi:hypothetical protein [Fimbriimonas ginsengisoli]|uniref:Uncharacterized protein n=1 Tax=Fimbriimonas ginsengisoli Gsoil 348 TaxID=661478 RepID=A0A068NPE1_FIMGI|nr:hypothetical protein [Fimbriimonas ginsengisoli]AIE83454.1 hypothetical protein OP10G_0086 [Fimbriimonas ginsengisoli Gsoil 348]